MTAIRIAIIGMGHEPHQEAIRWLAADWLEGTLPDCGNGVSPHRVKHLIAYMNDDWLPGEPATKAARRVDHLRRPLPGRL